MSPCFYLSFGIWYTPADVARTTPKASHSEAMTAASGDTITTPAHPIRPVTSAAIDFLYLPKLFILSPIY